MATLSEQLGLVKPDLNLDIKYDEFSRFCVELKDKLGSSVTMKIIIDAEVAKVLEKAIVETGKASPEKIAKSWQTRKWTTLNGKKYNLDWKMPNAVWNLIVDQRNTSVARKLLARGLTAQSWFLLARKMGFIVDAPNYVQGATAKNAQLSANVEVEREESGGNYGIGVTNRMPILRFNPPGGLAALFTALAGRIKFFEQNLARGVFDDVDAIAKKYPGIQAAKTNEAIANAVTYE